VFALMFLTRSQPFLCTRVAGHGDDLLEDGWGFTPKCQMDDAERFRGCLPLTALCSACGDVRITVSCHYCIVGISHYLAAPLCISGEGGEERAAAGRLRGCGPGLPELRHLRLPVLRQTVRTALTAVAVPSYPDLISIHSASPSSLQERRGVLQLPVQPRDAAGARLSEALLRLLAGLRRPVLRPPHHAAERQG
jgi:hypothetical protein